MLADVVPASVSQLAAGQNGVVTRAQLRELGLGRGMVDRWLATGRLHPLQRGVYLVGHPVAPSWAPETAAVLASGPGAVLSHRSAAMAWGLCAAAEDEPIDLTVCGRDGGRRPGVRMRRSRAWDPEDLSRRHGLPVSAPARTLVDLAAEVSPERLERLWSEADRRGVVIRPQLDRAIARRPSFRGSAALARLIRSVGEPRLTRSEAEARMLALIRRAGLPVPETNVRVGGFEVDMLWRDARLVLEIDGWAYHRGRRAWESDHARPLALAGLGLREIRVSWRQIVGRELALAASIGRALGEGGASLRMTDEQHHTPGLGSRAVGASQR